MGKKVERVFVWLGIGVALFGSGKVLGDPLSGPWAVSVYGGPSMPGTITNMFVGIFPEQLEPFGLVAIAGSRKMVDGGAWISGDVAAQIAKHFESWDLWETDWYWEWRLYRVPWEGLLPGSFSWANGVSHATRVPRVESKDYVTDYRTLYYFHFAWGVALDRWIPGLEAFLRIHHRSGMWGLIAPKGVGSNFVTLGMRYGW